MTEDTLKQANKKMHDIEETQKHIDKIQKMMDLDSISLYSETTGPIVLKGDVKADVLATVYHDQVEWLEELQDDFRML